jgi:hypothetical protein
VIGKPGACVRHDVSRARFLARTVRSGRRTCVCRIQFGQWNPDPAWPISFVNSRALRCGGISIVRMLFSVRLSKDPTSIATCSVLASNLPTGFLRGLKK